MTGHQERYWIGGAGAADGTRPLGPADLGSNFAKGRSLALWKGTQALPYLPLEGGGANIER